MAELQRIGYMDFDDFLADAPHAASRHGTARRLHDTDLLIVNGEINRRPIVKHIFTPGCLRRLAHHNLENDMLLVKVHCAQPRWNIDTGEGGQVHLLARETRAGLSNNDRRFIQVDGKGALVLHFTSQELETALIKEKDGQALIVLAYTKGIVVRGPVKLAYHSSDDHVHELPLRTFARIKRETTQALAASSLAQNAVGKSGMKPADILPAQQDQASSAPGSGGKPPRKPDKRGV